MRKSVFYVLFFFAFLLCQNAEAKLKQKPVYLFGFAISFADSSAYITDVQYLETSYVDTKTKFLVGRNIYSVQLQQYLEKNEDCKQPVTSIFFGKKKEKVEKKMLSIRHRYEKDKGLTLKTVTCPFNTEEYDDQVITEDPISDETSDNVSKTSKKSKKKSKA